MGVGWSRRLPGVAFGTSRRERMVRLGLLVATMTVVAIVGVAAAAPTGPGVKEAWERRSEFTSEFGVAHPVGVTYDTVGKQVLVADKDGTLIRLSAAERLAGTSRLPGGDPLTLAFDPSARAITVVSGKSVLSAPAAALRSPSVDLEVMPDRLDVTRVNGSTFDPGTGIHYLLDGDRRSVFVVDPTGVARRTRTFNLDNIPSTELKGIAFNPADGLLYVASYPDDTLYAVDTTGRLVDTYSLASVELANPQAMAFAPTADNTDDPALTSLLIADAGTDTRTGSVVEVSLAPEPAPAPDIAATLVHTTNLFEHDPPSPDPVGDRVHQAQGGADRQ